MNITRTAPGFHVGKDGKSYFGTDPENPWGSMRHGFWPRCKVEGSIITKNGEVDFTGRGFFVHALQGMKPHHAGKPLMKSGFENRTIRRNFLSSREMEFCRFPITHLFRRHDGVHNPACLWLDCCECWRDCTRWGNNMRRLGQRCTAYGSQRRPE